MLSSVDGVRSIELALCVRHWHWHWHWRERNGVRCRRQKAEDQNEKRGFKAALFVSVIASSVDVAAYGLSGSKMVNLAPLPVSESHQMSPWWASIKFLQIESPSPVPPYSRVDELST